MTALTAPLTPTERRMLDAVHGRAAWPAPLGVTHQRALDTLVALGLVSVTVTPPPPPPPAPAPDVQPGQTYQHVRTRDIYRVRAVLTLDEDHFEGTRLYLRAPVWQDAAAAGDLHAGQPSVVYMRNPFAPLWVRDASEFLDGRFVRVTLPASICGYYDGDAINRARIREVMASAEAGAWQIEEDPAEPGEYLIKRKVV